MNVRFVWSDEEDLNWSLPPDFSQRINRQVQEALRQAERGLRQALSQMKGARREWSTVAATRREDEGASESHRESVSEEERLAVLRMLAEKRISVEEAEALLAALEGRAGG